MKKKLNQKGSISFFIVFVALAVILLILFAAVIPLLIAFDTALYEGAEDIILDANKTAGNIQNAEIKASLQSSLQASTDTIPTQIDIMSNFFQYGWILVIVVIVLVLFMISRQTVEVAVR